MEHANEANQVDEDNTTIGLGQKLLILLFTFATIWGTIGSCTASSVPDNAIRVEGTVTDAQRTGGLKNRSWRAEVTYTDPATGESHSGLMQSTKDKPTNGTPVEVAFTASNPGDPTFPSESGKLVLLSFVFGAMALFGIGCSVIAFWPEPA